MGLFLQKTNIIRDYLVGGCSFWSGWGVPYTSFGWGSQAVSTLLRAPVVLYARQLCTQTGEIEHSFCRVPAGFGEIGVLMGSQQHGKLPRSQPSGPGLGYSRFMTAICLALGSCFSWMTGVLAPATSSRQGCIVRKDASNGHASPAAAASLLPALPLRHAARLHSAEGGVQRRLVAQGGRLSMR